MSEELLGKIKGLDSKSLEDLKRLIKKYGGSLPKAQYSMNLDNSQSQGILGSENSGYNPLSNITLDNNISNANFSNYSAASNVNDNMVPPEGETFYNINDQLIAILYEVKNTFGEQHTYVFKVEGENKSIQNNCSKKFHVSPFIEMKCNYFFRILKPGNKISVVIDQYDSEGKILFASQEGVRTDLNSKYLLKSYIKHPIMTFKIILAIHYEAFKLWTKGIKFIKKKIKIKNNISIEN